MEPSKVGQKRRGATPLASESRCRQLSELPLLVPSASRGRQFDLENGAVVLRVVPGDQGCERTEISSAISRRVHELD